MKKIRYFLEAVIVYFFFYLFKIIGIDAASSMGGFIARIIGKKLAVTKHARKNVKLAFPDFDEAKIDEIITGMWDNLGRVFGEFSHIATLTDDEFSKRVKFRGEENIAQCAAKDKGFIIFSGHIANWELGAQSLAHMGHQVAPIYRHANNPWVEKLVLKTRKKVFANIFAKGYGGARQILKHINNNGNIGMLIDQKMNDGIAVPFFGRDAMTAPAMADFALKLGVSLVPSYVRRVKGAHFEINFLPEMDVSGKTSYEIMLEVNQMLEKWITSHPEQWFWVHKRWGKLA